MKLILGVILNDTSLFLGKPHSENIYVKVSLGAQEQETNLAKETFANGNAVQNGAPPIPLFLWNYNMQFQLRNVNQEILTFVVQEQNLYGPDGMCFYLIHEKRDCCCLNIVKGSHSNYTAPQKKCRDV